MAIYIQPFHNISLLSLPQACYLAVAEILHTIEKEREAVLPGIL